MTSNIKKTKFCGTGQFTDPPAGFTKEQCPAHMEATCRSNGFNNKDCISYYKTKGTRDYTSDLTNFCRNYNPNTTTDQDMKNACACHLSSSVYKKFHEKFLDGVTDPNVIATMKKFSSAAPSCNYPDCQGGTAIPQHNFNSPCPNNYILNCINQFTADIGELKGNVDNKQKNECIQNADGGNITINKSDGNSASDNKEESITTLSFILLILAIFAALWTIILGLVFKNMIVIVISGFVTLCLLLGSFLTKKKTVIDSKTTGVKRIQTAKAASMISPSIVTYLKNEKSNMCLDVTDVEAYGKLIDTPCKNLPSQKYMLEPSIQRISANSLPTLCIDDVIATQPLEQKLQIFDNIPGSKNQTFVYKRETKQIENTSKNLCISRGNDGFYYLDVCKDVAEQKFDLI